MLLLIFINHLNKTRSDLFSPTGYTVTPTEFNMENSVKLLIDKIKQRPAMYLGKNYISCLRAFIDGWYLREPDKVTDGYLMADFQEWIEKKYNVKTTQGWANIILFYSQDETSALEKFFVEFDLFCEECHKHASV